jgi:hypothetical protein
MAKAVIRSAIMALTLAITVDLLGHFMFGVSLMSIQWLVGGTTFVFLAGLAAEIMNLRSRRSERTDGS